MFSHGAYSNIFFFQASPSFSRLRIPGYITIYIRVSLQLSNMHHSDLISLTLLSWSQNLKILNPTHILGTLRTAMITEATGRTHTRQVSSFAVDFRPRPSLHHLDQSASGCFRRSPVPARLLARRGDIKFYCKSLVRSVRYPLYCDWKYLI